MIDALVETWLLSFLLVLVRVSAFVVTMPLFGGGFVPRYVKAGLVLSLSVFWFFELGTGPAELYFSSGHSHWFNYILAITRELVLGWVLGTVFALVMVPFRIAGEFVGQEMGLTLARLTDPTLTQVGTVFGQTFEVFGVLLFLSFDVHHVFIAAFHSAFARHPVGGSLIEIPVAKYVSAMSLSQEWGILLAAPIAFCLILTTLMLAVMSRIAPQLNIMSIGFALRLTIGLLATFILLPEQIAGMRGILERFSVMLYGLI